MSPCYSSINHFLYEVMMKRTKRKWSQSNLMATIRILLNSYYGMFEFLDLPEALWISLIRKRQEEEKSKNDVSFTGIYNKELAISNFYRTAIVLNR